MEAWWSSLATPLQVYYGIALVTSAVLLLQAVLTLFGLDSDIDIDTDFDLDVEHGSGLGFLSVRTATAFFTGFGWGGVIGLESGWPFLAATLLAVVLGSALMTSVYFLMRGIASLRYSGTLDYRNAVGQTASVYLPIPPRMEGIGQVEVMVQGRLRTVRAFTKAPLRISNRARVKVVDVVDSTTLLVEPLDPSPPEPGDRPEEG